MMKLLLQEQNKIVSNNILLEKIWGYDSEATENNVEVYIGFLRKKLRALDSNLTIKTSRGLGYLLVEGEE